jgi:HK97 family phage portal protein
MILDRILERFRRPTDTGWIGSQYAAGDLLTPFVNPVAYGTIANYQTGKPIFPARDTATLSMQGYEKIALIYACVGLIADTAAAIPMRVYDEDAEGQATTLPDHPMRQLMRRPNPQMSEREFYQRVIAAALLAPVSIVEKVRSASGRVVQLWPLNSAWAFPILRSQAPPDWEYRIPGLARPIILTAEDVMVYRWRGRTDGSPYGLCPLEIILREIGLSNVMIDHLVKFFQKGALPQLAIRAKTMGRRLSQDEINDLNEQLLGVHGGLGNSSLPLWLGAIDGIDRIGFDFNELAWTDLRDINDLSIVQAFGVPATMVQTRVGLQHSDSRANAEVDEAKFYRQTILPCLAALDGMFTLGLLEEFELPGSRISLEFDTSDVRALQEDRNARATSLTPAFLQGGIPASVFMSELGLPEPAEDFYLRSFATEAIPADDPLNKNKPKPPAPVVTQVPPPAGQTAADPNAPKLSASMPLELTSGLGPRQLWRAAIGATNKAAIARIAEARQPSFAVFLAEQESRVIAAARRMQFSARERYEALAIDWPAEDRFLHIGTQQLWELAAQTAYDIGGQTIGAAISFDLANPHLAAVMDRVATRVRDINATTEQDIQRILTEALAEGANLAELEARLRGLYEETYNGRSMTIARSESQVAYNSASAAGYRQSGVVDRIQCFDNPDHPDNYGASDGLSCAQRNGLIAPLADAEKHIDAEHPNGQLAIAPVLTGEVVA